MSHAGKTARFARLEPLVMHTVMGILTGGRKPLRVAVMTSAGKAFVVWQAPPVKNVATAVSGIGESSDTFVSKLVSRTIS